MASLAFIWRVWHVLFLMNAILNYDTNSTFQDRYLQVVCFCHRGKEMTSDMFGVAGYLVYIKEVT